MAVKLFRLDLPPDRMHQLVAGFERLIAARLDHPAIATPIATGTDGIVVYIVQTFVAGDALDVVVRADGAAPPAHAVRVAVQLAAALDYAAVADIHHGALHPRDVLLSREEAHLTGLGVTRVLESVGVTPTVRRPYTAPERIAGGPWDRRADVFSFAALMHEMLWARRVAGTGRDAAESLTPLPGGDLAALKEVFARGLAVDPADRFPTALDLAAALKDAFPGLVLAPVVVAEREAPSPGILPALQPMLAYDSQPMAADTDDAAFQLPEPERPDAAGLEDFALQAAEDQRYEDVEVAPAIVPAASGDAGTNVTRVTGLPAALTLGATITPDPYGADVSPGDRSTSTRPAAIALIVGLAAGFAGGYLTGSRQRNGAVVPSAPAAARATPTPVPGAAAGREYTEGAVKPEPSAPGTDGAAPAPPPRPTPPAAPPVAPPTGTGRLLVRSTPADAQVLVDGRDRGRTPATIRDLANGAHRVRVVREGYAAEERRFVITAKRPAQSMTIVLERTGAAAAGSGTLEVQSRPTGARVFLDGRLMGTTPFSSSRIPAGEHAIRLELDGHRRWTTRVRVASGERNQVRASLER